MLARTKRETLKDDYESRNLGRFKKIFPPEDKFRREKYAALMEDAFSIFLPGGRAGGMKEEIERLYKNPLRVIIVYNHFYLGFFSSILTAL